MDRLPPQDLDAEKAVLGSILMDATAISLCKDNRMPIIVFNLRTHGHLKRVVLGERVGSLITAD